MAICKFCNEEFEQKRSNQLFCCKNHKVYYSMKNKSKNVLIPKEEYERLLACCNGVTNKSVEVPTEKPVETIKVSDKKSGSTTAYVKNDPQKPVIATPITPQRPIKISCLSFCKQLNDCKYFEDALILIEDISKRGFVGKEKEQLDAVINDVMIKFNPKNK